MFVTNALARIFGGIAGFFAGIGSNIFVFTWDFALFLLNLVSFKRKIGEVTLKGDIGYGGKWPMYIPPTETDSRSACPALNAMANHGILPHDGRNISYKEMSIAIRKMYNFAPSFCYFVPKYMAELLTRDHTRDTINLSDISVHNGIEHDASLTRHDVYHQPDQSKPALDIIDDLLASATGPDNTLTPHDLSVVSTRRRRQARATNSTFTLSTFHKLFGSSNSSTLLTIFGGRVSDLEIVLKEERIPDGWESRVRDPWGLTFATFNNTVFRVELGIEGFKGPSVIVRESNKRSSEVKSEMNEK
ncbi:chloroperoxidase-like protein [Fomitiporia mediterranea MF3/22]|uniref:chloroperoxidase-like protein n=1 Tax=Fomitiporia mediterranea (strain MF3/22) TaxID=694068 RepID=UPI0004407A55|nr:chloroperoxidase-like protein [Fomitiporia mediterranea MF3/22]EJD01868.1 chloroperoxidase-like protein [Fomitiporia mediterranea MF3/22]